MNIDFALYQAQFPYAIPAFAFVFGSIIGSFLNVVVYRLPIMLQREWQQQAIEIIDESVEDKTLVQQLRNKLPTPTDRFNLVVPNSTCPRCKAAIKPWHNIPIIGYFLIGGRCASCDVSISARYPIVELLTALLTMTAVIVFGANIIGISAAILIWALISLSLIDYDTQLLPDDITLPFLWLGLIVNCFGVFTSFTSAFFGAVAGYLILWTVYQAFRLVTGKEGMGYGDFKMLAMLGAWLGVQAIPLIIVLSSFAGVIIGGALILLGRDKNNPIRFGPFLAIAGLIALLWGNVIIQNYLALVAP